MTHISRTFAFTASFLLLILPSTVAEEIRKQDSERRVIQKSQGHQQRISVKTQNRREPVESITGSILKLFVSEGRLHLLLSVADQNLEPLDDLKPTNFKITLTVNGDTRQVPAEAIELQRPSAKDSQFFTVLLRDTSDSMSDMELQQATLAIQRYIDQMRPNQQIELIDFCSGIHTRAKFTSDKKSLNVVLKEAVERGGTAFYSALLQAIGALENISDPQAVRFVIAFTDGEDSGSQHSLGDVLLAAKAHAIPIFCIGIGGANPSILQTIARETNGLYLYAADAKSLTTLYEKISKFLEGLYIVSVPSKAASADEITVKTRITYVGGNKEVSNQLEISTRR